mgnify:CR=1 FL=1
MLERLLYIHLEHFGDVLAAEPNLQRLVVEAMTAAHRAGHPDVGQELHVDAVGPVALARLASAAAGRAGRHVEAESPGLVAADLGVGQGGVEVANLVEDLDVRRRIAPRRAADGFLVDVDDLVEVLEPFDGVVQPRGDFFRAVQPPREFLTHDVDHQRALAAARHTGHADEPPEREVHVDVLEVVVSRPAHGQPSQRIAAEERFAGLRLALTHGYPLYRDRSCFAPSRATGKTSRATLLNGAYQIVLHFLRFLPFGFVLTSTGRRCLGISISRRPLR